MVTRVPRQADGRDGRTQVPLVPLVPSPARATSLVFTSRRAAGRAAMNTRPRPFRFGASVSTSGSKQEWMALARTVEGLGYSTVQVPDHVSGQFALVPALVSAAEATHTVRLGSFVFKQYFQAPGFAR